MPSNTILFIADPHLGHDKPGHQASFEEILIRVEPIKPQLAVILGDVTQDGKKDPAYFPYARDQIERLPCKVICIPGNHEEGYNVHRTAWPPPVERAFLPRFASFFNDMPWTKPLGRVQILGIDSQILGSGFDEEAHQIKWLTRSLREGREAGRFTVVVMHTPLFVATPGAKDDPHDYWAVPHPARADLLTFLKADPPDMLLAGHVHRHIEVKCRFCKHYTLASSSFQANTIWSVDNDKLPAGSDDLCFYTMNADADDPTLTRHILDHQDRHK